MVFLTILYLYHQVAVGRLKELQLFGNDYPTKDGKGIRDYIHVVDLALGYIKTLEKVLSSNGVEAYNLGTCTGYSVLEMIKGGLKRCQDSWRWQEKNPNAYAGVGVKKREDL